MRVLWYSDLHISGSGDFSRPSASGYTTRIDDAFRAASWISDVIVSKKIDLVVNGGDIFKHQGALQSLDFSAAVKFLTIVDSACREVEASQVVLLGNHDYISNDRRICATDFVDSLPNSRLIRDIELVEIGDGWFGFIPYLLDWSILTTYWDTFRRYTENGIPVYLFGHMDLNGVINANVNSRQILSTSGISPETLSKICTFCFNGHHHIPQIVGGKKNIILSGSLQQFTVSEAAGNFSRGLYILDTEKKSCEHLPVGSLLSEILTVSSLEDLRGIDRNNYIVFRYSDHLSREEAEEILKEFRGYRMIFTDRGDVTEIDIPLLLAGEESPIETFRKFLNHKFPGDVELEKLGVSLISKREDG